MHDDKCEDCKHYHPPGPCYPSDEEQEREDGWRLYNAMRATHAPRKPRKPFASRRTSSEENPQ